jgi:type IV secretion system protein VirB10
MRLWGRTPPDTRQEEVAEEALIVEGEDAQARVPRPELRSHQVEGERGIGSINRVRSLQSRLTRMLAIGLFGLIGLGVLSWYYSRAFSHSDSKQGAAKTATQTKTQSEMTLPPLGAFSLMPAKASESGEVKPREGIPPAWLEPAKDENDEIEVEDEAEPRRARHGQPGAPIQKPQSPAELDIERKLAGPAFQRTRDSGQASQAIRDLDDVGVVSADPLPSAASGGEIEAILKPTATPAVAAKVLPTQRLLLPKGAFIDCTLETAIDSSLPGMTTCITAADTFGADGTTVLLERGTKLVGETRGESRQGLARVFVLWTEARTPTGVVVALESPGTDALGRAGLTGDVNRHFMERFGAAILLSIVDAGVQAAAQSGGTSVVVNPSNSSDVVTEVLKSTVSIPPTVTVKHGSRVQVLVARDLDFRSVYRLVSKAESVR